MNPWRAVEPPASVPVATLTPAWSARRKLAMEFSFRSIMSAICSLDQPIWVAGRPLASQVDMAGTR